MTTMGETPLVCTAYWNPCTSREDVCHLQQRNDRGR